MELKFYLEFLRRRWWLLLFGPLITASVAFFVTQQMKPVYQATTTILVNKVTTPGVIDYNDVLTSERLTNTYALLVERPSVLDRVVTRLSLSIDRAALEKKISVSPIKDTQLLSLSATDIDPDFAATLANTTAQAFADDNASQQTASGIVTIAKQADVPLSPVSPNLVLNMMLAIVLGVVIAAGLGLLLDYLDDTVKTEDDVETVTGLPILGRISRFKPNEGPAFSNDLQSHTGEAYRQLRTNVHFATLGKEMKTLVITSANPEEGKSTTSSNLATVLAQAGDRVILVDTDLRRSSLRRTFDTPSLSAGLTGLLLNEDADPLSALVETRWPNLKILPAGILPPNPSELLTSPRMQKVMQTLRTLADYVIFDTPPVLAVTDALVLASRVDGVLVVTEAGQTRTDALRQVARQLRQANVNAIGVVLNKAKLRQRDYHYYREEESKTKKRRPFRISSHQAPVSQTPFPLPVTSLASAAQVVTDATKALEAPATPVTAPAPEPVAVAANGHRNGHANGNGRKAGVSGRPGNGKDAGPEAAEETDVSQRTLSELLAQLDQAVMRIRAPEEDEKQSL